MSGLSYVHPRAAVEAKTATEARRWKDEHEKMQKVAAELAYKATAAQRQLDDLTLKHKNLHDNHVAMQTKYRALKQQGGEQDWKGKAKTLAERFEKHVQDTRQDVMELAKLKGEMPAVQAKLQELKRLKKGLPDDVLARLQELNKLKQEMPEVQAKLKELKRVQKELASMKGELNKKDKTLPADVQAKLQELASLKREMPDVQARLRELANLKREMPDVQAKLKELASLKREMPDVQARLRELANLKREMPEVQAKLLEGRNARLEAASARDSVLHERAAKHNISEALEACKKMLANTEGVLRVCADLHAKQSSGGELSCALLETTDKMRTFLRDLSY